MSKVNPLIVCAPLFVLSLWADITCAQATALPAPPQSPAPVAQFEYDAEGNPTRTVVAPGVSGFGLSTRHSYDPLGQRKATTDARNGVTQFGYDGQGRLTQVTDPRNLVTQYQLNGLGDQSALLSPDTGTDAYTYDAAGNLKTRTDARGFVSTYSYDALNRLTQLAIQHPTDGTQRNLRFTYDLNDARHGYGVGRLTRTSTPEAATDYLYDALGRILNVGTYFNADATYYVAHFAYDAAGQVSQVRYPSGRVVEYQRANGQLTGLVLQANAGGAKQTLISDVQRSPFGPVRSWKWQQVGGARLHERIFDAYGRIVRYPLGTAVRDVSYDAADRIVAYTHYDSGNDAPKPGMDQRFGYDELGRLKTASQGTQSWRYDYDATGNRTLSEATSAGSTRNYTIASNSNRVTQISNPARALSYDAAGNTLSDGNGGSAYTAVYNHEGRLAQLTGSGGTVMKLVYNAQGQRVRKQIGSNPAVYYAYDLQGQLLGEYTLVGTQYKPLIEYIWLEGQPVAVVRPTPGAPANADNSSQEVFYVHTDHLGAPRVATDLAGNTRWRWLGGEPFGVSPAETNPNGLGDLNITLRFPGQQYDGFVGLHYNYFRDFDPTTGRYVQSDPIGVAGGINTYAYVDGNPLSYTDPEGLQAIPLPPPILPPPVIVPNPDYPYTPAPPSFTWPKLLPDSWVDKIIQMCSDSAEECRKKCDAANTEQVRICKMAPTARAREACYSRANELYGQCLKKCK